ncbi:hypothetical protein [Gelatiniphilus marinus]|uniref:Calx-beta domain-containing protein n=1 Tax=Gelatiniphilus marinus TaxID=1759464 RepID=A0ABW5JNU0_9FLAO
MKNIKSFIFLLSLVAVVSCSSDDSITDPVYEFIAFQAESVTINEFDASTSPEPIVIDLLGYEPKEDITINLSVVENNATEGVDYTLSTKTLLIEKGNYTSEPLLISTIDNVTGSLEDRSIDIYIESTSNPNLNIGLGLDSPTKAFITVNIADDECSSTTDVFNSSNVQNETPSGTFPVVGSVNGDVVTFQGDLIAYGPFPNVKVDITLTPVAQGATKGSATFNQQVAGTDNDGYVYAFSQVGEGTYDVCSGTVSVEYDVVYESGGDWVYWYTITNKFKLP